MKSGHGEISQVFKLAYTGPKGEWLDVEASGSKGEKEKTDFGHKEGNFLSFTLGLKQPDGRRVKTFFVGIIKKHEIVGTFVDDGGITGEWTAVPVVKSPKSP